MGWMRNASKIFLVNLKGRNHMGSHNIYDSMVLKLFLAKQDEKL